MAKIWIDAGHGGSDPGAVANGLIEKTWVLNVCLRVAQLLRSFGHVVGETRTNDTAVALDSRGGLASKFGANAFVSVHFNAGGGQGFESFRMSGVNGTDLVLQQSVHSQVMSIGTKYGLKDRGLKQANYSVLRNSVGVPAILVEAGFCDSSDSKILANANYQEEFAQAVAKGVNSFLGGNNTNVPNTSNVAVNATTINVVALARDTQVKWVPEFQKKYAGILLATRVRGEGNDRIVIEGIPFIYVDQVYNILRTGAYKIPNNQLNSDKGAGRIVIDGLAKNTQIAWVPKIQVDLSGYLLANDINGNVAGTIEIKNIPSSTDAATIRKSLEKEFKIPVAQIK